MWVQQPSHSLCWELCVSQAWKIIHSGQYFQNFSPLPASLLFPTERSLRLRWEEQRDETQCCPHFSLTSPTARHRWWKRGPSWRKRRAAPSLKKHIHEFVQGKLSMRTGTSPFSSPAQSPGVIPASCMRFMCLPPTTLTSRQDVGRLRQEEVLDKWKKMYKSRVYWHLDHVCERLL